MKLNSLLMTLLAACSLASCGGEPGLTSLNRPAGTVTAAQAAVLAGGTTLTNFIGNARPDQKPNFGGPVRGNDRNMSDPFDSRDADFDSCASVTAADQTDNDGDGIKMHIAAKFNCVGIAGESNNTFDLVGSFEQKDLDDSQDWALGGYLFNYNLNFKNTTDASNTLIFRFKGFFSAENTGTMLTQTSNFYYGGSGIHNGVELDYLWQGDYEASFTPTSMASPYADGTANFSGGFKVKGDFSHGTNSATLDVVFGILGENLVYDSTCSNYYRSGSVSFTDGSSNVIMYTYNCTTAVATYNGTTL
jgi:hypothetical protein